MTTPGIAVPGTVVPSGSLTSPSGAQGIQGVAGETYPIGVIVPYASTTAPPTWMICDGSAISRTIYPVLFSLIGTTFGAGDGSTTFNLPDLRGRVGVGAGQGASLTNRVLAATGGEEAHVLTVAELASHTHTSPFYVSGQGTAGGGGIAVPTTGATGPATGSAGTNGAHNTMQPFVVVAYIIKVSSGGGATAQAPIADTTQNGLLRQVSGKLTDFVDGTNNCQALQPVIWSARLRGFNAIGNPTFEVDQRTVGAGVTGAGWAQDRWWTSKTGTMVISAKQTAGLVNYPGTSFAVTQDFLRFTLTTQESSLAAGDVYAFAQVLEGIRLRELINDTHSLGILCRSSVANLAFSAALVDSGSAYSITHLFTLGAANTWTWIPWNAIANFTGSTTWFTAPGTLGYYLYITLAAGSNYVTTPDVWTNANKWAATGTGNFAASAVNATFDVAFIQHEPGLSSMPIDCPFTQNLDDCLRYFCKSCDYDIAVGSTSGTGYPASWQNSTTVLTAGTRFPKPMAKIPTVTIYNTATGAANSIYFNTVSYAVNTVTGIGKTGFLNISTATLPAVIAGATAAFHYIADTGW